MSDHIFDARIREEYMQPLSAEALSRGLNVPQLVEWIISEWTRTGVAVRKASRYAVLTPIGGAADFQVVRQLSTDASPALVYGDVIGRTTTLRAATLLAAALNAEPADLAITVDADEDDLDAPS